MIVELILSFVLRPVRRPYKKGVIFSPRIYARFYFFRETDGSVSDRPLIPTTNHLTISFHIPAREILRSKSDFRSSFLHTAMRAFGFDLRSGHFASATLP